jgi:hypothetical protein
MGVLIGATADNSTWGKNRTPIFSTYFAWQLASHNLICTDGFAPENGGFFRAARWPELAFWTDPLGATQTSWLGAFAYPGSPLPTSIQFFIGGFNVDPADAYAPNYLDDVEVQAHWVGRNVVLDPSGTYAMDYAALNGVNGSFQTVSPSNDVLSFDL